MKSEKDMKSKFTNKSSRLEGWVNSGRGKKWKMKNDKIHIAFFLLSDYNIL